MASIAFSCTGALAEVATVALSLPRGSIRLTLLLFILSDEFEAQDALAILQVLAIWGHISLKNK